ncbi:MAG: SRPBCC family protein [Acidimicrobiales bacterium]
MHDSVTVHMDASPADVWALVADVTRIGEFSPETFEAEWLDGATEPAVGATFRGHVKRNGKGPIYWSPAEITACEPERVFEFAVPNAKSPINTWRYELAPGADGGTDVTESFRLADKLPTKIYWFLAGWARGKTNREGMRTTLERMRAVVEAG